MKNSWTKRIILITFVSFFVVAVILSLVLLFPTNSDRVEVQNIDYTEANIDLLNPDQGFYRTACIKMTPISIEDRSYIIREDFQLYHLRLDISAFSSKVNGVSDVAISNDNLDMLRGMLDKFLLAEKNVIIRFAYDPGFAGEIDKEPSESTILSHIASVCGVLNEYPLTITAIEAGMVGPWGEMHSSKLANSTTISNIIDTYLTNTNDIPILVRTPKMIYDYLGISIDNISSYTINKSDIAYRLGLFNDGFMGSDTDLGTYTDRNAEIQWLSKQTGHLPFGGEVTRPSSTIHDMPNCLTEMNDINLSYLNYEWNDEIVQGKWLEQKYNDRCGTHATYYDKSAYEYIRDHMGYRLLIEKSEIKYSTKYPDKQLLSLSIQNLGFGNLNREKNIDIYLVDNDGNITTLKSVCKYSGASTMAIDINTTNLSGEYNVYVAINSIFNEDRVYHVRFANNLWNDDLKANFVGKISK